MEAFAGTPKKRGVYHLWKKGQAIQKDCRDLVRSFRVQNRKERVQLGLRLTTVVRDNKK